MKIMRIEAYRADLAYAGGVYRLSGGREYRSFDATIVALHCDDGTVGWGESTPFGSTYVAAHGEGVRSALGLLAPAVIGLDPRCHDRVQDAMDSVLTGHAAAKTAIDVACWDAHGKSAGLPVCDLLGGRIAEPVPVISSIGSDTPDAMRAGVARHREAGFRGHSVKIGADEHEGGPALDAERIAACLADRRPGEWFLADANGGMTPESVLRMLRFFPTKRKSYRSPLCQLAGNIVIASAVQASHPSRRTDPGRCRPDPCHCRRRLRRGRAESQQAGRADSITAPAGHRLRGGPCHVGAGHHRIGDCFRRNPASGAVDPAASASLCS